MTFIGFLSSQYGLWNYESTILPALIIGWNQWSSSYCLVASVNLYNYSISSDSRLLWRLFGRVATCQSNRKPSVKLWPQIMFSLSSVTEKAFLFLLVSLFILSYSLLIGCHYEQPAVGQEENSDYKAPSFWRRMEDVLFARRSWGKKVEEVFEWITGCFPSILSCFFCLPPIFYSSSDSTRSSSSSLVCQADG